MLSSELHEYKGSSCCSPRQSLNLALLSSRTVNARRERSSQIMYSCALYAGNIV